LEKRHRLPYIVYQIYMATSAEVLYTGSKGE